MTEQAEIVGLDKHRGKPSRDPGPTQPGHTSDLPVKVLERDITVIVSTHHTGHNAEGRPTATYQVAYRIGDDTPPTYMPTRDEVEYMARAAEFAARKLREHYGVVPANPAIEARDELRQPLQKPS